MNCSSSKRVIWNMDNLYDLYINITSCLLHYTNYDNEYHDTNTNLVMKVILEWSLKEKQDAEVIFKNNINVITNVLLPNYYIQFIDNNRIHWPPILIGDKLLNYPYYRSNTMIRTNNKWDKDFCISVSTLIQDELTYKADEYFLDVHLNNVAIIELITRIVNELSKATIK